MSKAIMMNDIIKSGDYFKGDIFTYDVSDTKLVSDNQKNQSSKGNKVAYDTTWLVLLFKKLIDTETGEFKLVQIRKLEFENVLVGSKPSLPNKDDDPEKAKCMLTMFKELGIEVIRSGDYVPKVKENDADQTKENRRVDEMTQILYDNTKLFVKGLDYIAAGFQIMAEHLCEEFINTPDKFIFNMVKEANWVIKDKSGEIKMFNPPIRSIRQTHRKDDKNPNRTIKLDAPLYRLKMPVVNGKLLKSWNAKGAQKNEEYIYDARKTVFNKRSGEPTLVYAKIRDPITKSQNSPSIKNIGDFITYKSIISGTLELPKFSISKQGISLVQGFTQLIVKTHRSQQQKDVSIKTSTLAFMKGESSDDEDTEDDKLPELDIQSNPSESTQSSKSLNTKENIAIETKTDDEDDEDNATESSSEDDNANIIEVSKPKIIEKSQPTPAEIKKRGAPTKRQPIAAAPIGKKKPVASKQVARTNYESDDSIEL
jgi:hypothetical protein